MTLAAAVALVAVVVLVVVGLDRRDAATLVVALALEDCIMAGNLIVIACLAVIVAVVWWRGRLERRRVAEAVERTATAAARARASDEVAAAEARAARDRARPADEVLTEFARRGGRS